MRRFWSATSGSAIALLQLAGCASGDAREPSTTQLVIPAGPQLVAWVDRPASAYVAPTPTASPPPPDARPCTPADLVATSGWLGPAAGNVNLPVTLTNTARTECILNGYPTLAGISDSGAVTPLRTAHGSYFGDPGPTEPIRPGQAAAVNISTSSGCTASQHRTSLEYPRLRIGLPRGGTIDVPGHSLSMACGTSVSRFGVPSDLRPAENPPSSPLTATISAAPLARAGQIFRYTVTLTNTGTIAYRLDPCPAYYESVYGFTSHGRVGVERNYYLNCDAAKVLPAGGSTTFDMQIDLPVEMPANSPAKCGWSLHGVDEPGAGTVVQIVP